MNYLVTDLDTNANCDDNGGVDDAYVTSGNKKVDVKIETSESTN